MGDHTDHASNVAQGDTSSGDDRFDNLFDKFHFDPAATGAGDPFAGFVQALLANPQPNLPVVVGDARSSGATGDLLWAYTAEGLLLQATTGFLNTATGNGGFNLAVGRDGSFHLSFAGSTTELGYDAEGHRDGTTGGTTTPPAGNSVVYATTNGSVFANASAGHITYDGRGSAAHPVVGNDTVFGGVGDYLIGGTLAHQNVASGNVGNCVIYTSATKSSVPAGSVLVDMQNGVGFGSNAEGNQFVGYNQVRGSLQSNVLIGSASGSDLKSGANNSVLISLGGTGYELRPDGTGNVLVSTVGADRVLFDPSHGWSINDQNTLLGFNPSHGTTIDLTLLEHSLGISIASDLTGYLQLAHDAGGAHLLFSATDNFATSSHDILDLPLTHDLSLAALVASKAIVI